MARVILPNFPHHIIQRGNRRQDVFFKEEDYYLELLKEWTEEEALDVWVTNHVHLIISPNEQSDLSRAIGVQFKVRGNRPV